MRRENCIYQTALLSYRNKCPFLDVHRFRCQDICFVTRTVNTHSCYDDPPKVPNMSK